ncbi:hypothetical protein OAQ99_07535 [Candidatus Kapabacteria bacterium]|nr:hypothetical protein [Candidatus Kapabacteria bacterium]
MISFLKNQRDSHPVRLLIIAGLIVRLLAVIFAKGYGMHDDHFGPIEQPYKIMTDPSIWDNRGNPHGHSIFYPSIHYHSFKVMNSIGINDPQDKMLIIRFFHAIYSLLVIWFGYHIALIFSKSKKVAFKVGLVLSLFWIMPFMSVRNLIEMVTIPPLMAAFYFISKEKEKLFFAGLCFGLAFVFRYQTATFFAGAGLIWLFKGQLKTILITSLGFIASVTLIQGTVDWIAWGYPFAAPLEYFLYNTGAAYEYTTGPFLQYFVLFIGIFIPPLSLLILFGNGVNFKKNMILIIPNLFFFLFHSAFPNKQERFILPSIPFTIMIGIVGWEYFIKTSEWWKNRDKLLKGLWSFFWIINSALLIIFTFTYGKKNRVEPLYYLSKIENVTGVVVETEKMNKISQPKFYLNKDIPLYIIAKPEMADSVMAEVTYQSDNNWYIIFYGDKRLDQRVQKLEQLSNWKLELVKTVEPSLTDWLLHKANPKHNKNQISTIWKVRS